MKVLIRGFVALIRKEIAKEYQKPFKAFSLSVVKAPNPAFIAEIDGVQFERKDENITNKIFEVFDTQIKAKTNMDIDAIVAEVPDESNNATIWALWTDENGKKHKEKLEA